MVDLLSKEGECACEKSWHKTTFIVVTGGPGAGKTAILQLAKRHFCPHVLVLPEAASILYTGGFLRKETRIGREAAQRAIYHVQCAQEWMAREEKKYAVVLCDRGTLDGLAYWPGRDSSFFSALLTTREKELKRYDKVIHLHTPPSEYGYNHQNPARIENQEEAHALDKKTWNAWKGHPNHVNIASTKDFFEKVVLTIQEIQHEIPDCCRVHLQKRHMEYIEKEA